MGNGYSDEKEIKRQRICYKCKSFVTHDKADENKLACPLCGNKIDARLGSLTPRVSPEAFGKIVAAQFRAREACKK
ncbi:MAG: hypothetical protein NTX25_10810 [Proteobacteria bacterium]|nr:hypothetical protein [Pseudomonadota bacterium]